MDWTEKNCWRGQNSFWIVNSTGEEEEEKIIKKADATKNISINISFTIQRTEVLYRLLYFQFLYNLYITYNIMLWKDKW